MINSLGKTLFNEMREELQVIKSAECYMGDRCHLALTLAWRGYEGALYMDGIVPRQMIKVRDSLNCCIRGGKNCAQ